MRTAEQLIEQGIEIPTDAAEIARLLEASDEELAAAKSSTTETSTATTDADAAAAAAAEADAKAKKEADDAAAAAAAAAEAAKTTATVDEPDEEKGPPRALLRTYRETLHTRERELEEERQEKAAALEKVAALERDLDAHKIRIASGQEQLQAKADELGTGVDLKSLTPEKIAELRKTQDDDVVDIIEGLAKAAETLQERLASIETANKDLVEAREEAERRALIADIDSAPLLGVLRISQDAKADEHWKRAVAYQKAVAADPDFVGRPRREVLAEASRRMEAHLGKDAVKALLGDKPAAAPVTGKQKTPQQVIDEALEKAGKAAVPTSLSEIPAAGSAAAQDTAERVAGMSHADLANLMDSWIAAGKDVNELIGKLSTAA